MCSSDLKAAMQLPAMQKTWEQNGSDVPDITGDAFAKVVSSDVARWRKVVTEAGVKLD